MAKHKSQRASLQSTMRLASPIAGGQIKMKIRLRSKHKLSRAPENLQFSVAGSLLLGPSSNWERAGPW